MRLILETWRYTFFQLFICMHHCAQIFMYYIHVLYVYCCGYIYMWLWEWKYEFHYYTLHLIYIILSQSTPKKYFLVTCMVIFISTSCLTLNVLPFYFFIQSSWLNSFIQKTSTDIWKLWFILINHFVIDLWSYLFSIQWRSQILQKELNVFDGFMSWLCFVVYNIFNFSWKSWTNSSHKISWLS